MKAAVYARRIFSDEEVRDICELAADAETKLDEIADRFNASKRTIQDAAKGQSYKHIPRVRGRDRRELLRGTANHMAILTEPRVRAIAKLLKLGWSRSKIAKWAGVHVSTIQAITSGLTWYDVTGIPKKARKRKQRITRATATDPA